MMIAGSEPSAGGARHSGHISCRSSGTQTRMSSVDVGGGIIAVLTCKVKCSWAKKILEKKKKKRNCLDKS